MSQSYAKIRFIGYAIPTTPANMVAIGNPNGPGAVAGTYLGLADFQADVRARIAVLKNAAEVAKAALPLGEAPGSVLNLFVAPEFYFHGTQGPYLYGHGDPDPADFILDQLRLAFPASDYPDWTLVCGSAITSRVQDMASIAVANNTTVRNDVVRALSEQWLASYGPLNGVIFDMLVNFIKNCHGYPCMEVRNRALIVSNVALDTPTHSLGTDRMTCEKYFVSNEDFILYDTTGRKDVVTEQMTAYPFIDLSHGDLKATAKDKYAIFRQNYGPQNFPQYVDFGVEVCLDHSDVRLRRNIDNEPWPQPVDALHVQIIPSCGMQISAPSVAADAMGFVFNCDGQYALDATNGTANAGLQNGVQCLYANYIDSTAPAYAGHTQLARVQQPAVGCDPNRKGSSNASFETLASEATAVLAVPVIPDLAQCFAGGPGAVHIYGLQTPYNFYS
ncbi:hypothetical protein [Hydrogenophaga sp. RWCD_12]|uniref:hypothetical protein n=1 Tax=Hydrogenophaga sp. RWCD_12 TaxID=3391190 RepID=UPI0039854C3A